MATNNRKTVQTAIKTKNWLETQDQFEKKKTLYWISKILRELCIERKMRIEMWSIISWVVVQAFIINFLKILRLLTFVKRELINLLIVSKQGNKPDLIENDDSNHIAKNE